MDVERLKDEMSALLGSTKVKAKGIARLPRRLLMSRQRPPKSLDSANLISEIEDAASRTRGLTATRFSAYLMQAFGTDDLASLSVNDLRRVLRHLEVRASTQN